METVYDIIHYLNKLDFTDIVNDSDYQNLKCAQRKLLNDFEDYNIPKLIDVLSLIDNLFITLTFGDLQHILNETNTLRENILYKISCKRFVESNVESD